MDMCGPIGKTEWMDYGGDEDSIPTLKLVTEDSEMELDAARAEMKEVNDLEDRLGDNFEMPRSRRERRMEELNRLHNQRCQEESEALLRDKACWRENGLPLEEPGRYLLMPSGRISTIHMTGPGKQILGLAHQLQEMMSRERDSPEHCGQRTLLWRMTNMRKELGTGR